MLLFLPYLRISAGGENNTLTKRKNANSSFTNNDNYAELGKGIDFAADSFYGPSHVKIGADIFDSEWLDEKKEQGALNVLNNTKVRESSGFNLSEFSASLSNKYEDEAGVTLGEKTFSASLDADFETSMKTKISTYNYSFIYNYRYISYEYEKTLYNFADYDTYREHLDPGFVNNVTKLINNQMNYNDFFELYGTHIIASAKYGTSYSAYYTASSNSYDFSANTSINYSNKASAKFNYKNIPVSLTSSNSNNVDLGIDSKDYTYTDEIFCNVIGGDSSISIHTYSDFKKNINKWMSTKSGKEDMLFGTFYIPIWQMLPSTFNNGYFINKIKEYYTSYLSDKYYSGISDFNHLISVSSFPTSFTLIEENSKIKVQGSYHRKTVNFDSDLLAIVHLDTGLTAVKSTEKRINIPSLTLLKKCGFNYVNFNISMVVEEIDDGDRTIGIFNQTKKKTSADALLSQKVAGFEQGAAKYPLTYDGIKFDGKKMSLSDLTDGMMYIRFGSMGNGFNAYYLEYVNVIMTFCK